MQTFSIPRLNAKTPSAEQTKLLTALKGVKGVDSVKLQVAASTFTIEGLEKSMPNHEAIVAAATNAGFPAKKPAAPRSA